MTAVCEKFGHTVSYKYAICGADAIDKVGNPFPQETFEICRDADAVLFSAVGDPKFDNDPTDGGDTPGGGTRFRTSSEINNQYPNWLDGTTTESGKHSTKRFDLAHHDRSLPLQL